MTGKFITDITMFKRWKLNIQLVRMKLFESISET